MFLLLGKHVVVRVIMLCFKRQLWYQNMIWVSGRWRVGVGSDRVRAARCAISHIKL